MKQIAQTNNKVTKAFVPHPMVMLKNIVLPLEADIPEGYVETHRRKKLKLVELFTPEIQAKLAEREQKRQYNLARAEQYHREYLRGYAERDSQLKKDREYAVMIRDHLECQ